MAIPPNMGDQMLIDSNISDPVGFVATDSGTLKAENFDRVFVIGDTTNVPTAKAGSVAHYTAYTLVENLIREIDGYEATNQFDGHATCFLASGFELEDLTFLLKKVMRNVNNFNFTLDQLKNIIDFVQTVEPLLKTSVPQIIFFLDDLEQKGVFRLLNTTLEIMKNISRSFSPDDLEQMAAAILFIIQRNVYIWMNVQPNMLF